MFRWMSRDLQRASEMARSEGVTTVVRDFPRYLSERTRMQFAPSSPTEIEFDDGVVKVIPERSGTERNLYLYGQYEPRITELIHQTLSPGDTAIDIGAHVGHHTVSMRRAVGESGRVIAFEPSADRMAMLRRTVSANEYENVELIEAGVSNKRGTSPLDNAGSPTILSDTAESSDGAYPNVRTIVLDDLLEKEGIERANLIKMDIEGHEAKAIEGVSLDCVDSLVVEIHPDSIGRMFGEAALDGFVDRLSKFDVIENIDSTETVASVREEIRRTDGTLHLHCESYDSQRV